MSFILGGKKCSDSMQFVLGENNLTFRFETDGKTVKFISTVRDGEAIPVCTYFAAHERYGELTSWASGLDKLLKGKGIRVEYIIEIPETSKTDFSVYEILKKEFEKEASVPIQIKRLKN